jgi:predicted ester cyclase
MVENHHTDKVADNRALGSTFFHEQDRLRGGPAAHLCAADYIATIGGNPPMNRDGHQAFAVAFYAAFPDAVHHIETVFATDHQVAVRFVIRGTHTGSFFGVPPTGRAIVSAANVILDVADGRVSRLRGIFDEAGLLRQIGVLP